MRSLIGLLVVALIAVLAYRLYFSKMRSGTGSGAPAEAITIAGVKGDLLSIAQAERLYQAEHGSYASLDELTASGAMSLPKTGRENYTYEVETSASGFAATARCRPAGESCTSYTIDQTMEIRALP